MNNRTTVTETIKAFEEQPPYNLKEMLNLLTPADRKQRIIDLNKDYYKMKNKLNGKYNDD